MTDNNKNQIKSPCIRNCCLNENDVCLGCFRHVDEIIEWGSAEKKRRESILENARKRSADYAKRSSRKI